MLKTLLTRPRTILAGLLAILAATLTFIETERRGDPQVVVVEVERRIKAVEEADSRHMSERKAPDSPEPSDEEFEWEKADLVQKDNDGSMRALFDGQWVPVVIAQKNSKGEFRVVRVIRGISDSAWAELQTTWADLTWKNQRFAQATALRQFNIKPTDVSSYDWTNRVRDSSAQWQVQEVIAFQSRRVLYTAGAAIGTFIAVILFLAICSWLWRVLLARISELSNAIRGK